MTAISNKEPLVNQIPTQPGTGFPSPQKTNGMAIASLVLSLLGCSLLGIIFGGLAISQINKGQGSGKGLAIAGLVIGIVALIATILFWGTFMAALSLSEY
jgi:hypothetical protein